MALLAPSGFSKAQDSSPDAISASSSSLRRGNFENETERPLRYWPVNSDFVITNGAEYFNRPLYCMNSAFRIDGGDKPEFSLYVPGRGGNLRLGIKTSAGIKWLNDAQQIVTRYRAGSLLYEVRGPLLGHGSLSLAILPMSHAKGLIARVETGQATSPVDLVWAFGGANGMKGQRGGDIGCESKPVSQFFQLKPSQCRDQHFQIATNTFVLHGRAADIAGVFPTGSTLRIADANLWNSIDRLFATTNPEPALPVVIGSSILVADQPAYFSLQQIGEDTGNPDTADLPRLFSEAEAHRRKIAERVTVETPDAFINAAVPALNIAADAIWDDHQQSYMHGAVAWRTRLLGWRGPYAGDALGWHERTAAHFAGFARQQNVSPIPANIPPPDAQFNLARSEAAIHSNGDLSNNHYDMNLVAVDAFFRHLLWTGDTNYASALWPVIERHLAWERRLFRREFGPDKLPLYEAYAAIWASDDLNYNGAGTAHASAYNYFENVMAARLAKILGHDPAHYQDEADAILRGMNEYLWCADEGTFAESKDLLGLQLVHPHPGLWTFYITMDSGVPSPQQAWQMSGWFAGHIAHIPVYRSDSPSEHLFTMPETSWMPYQWSLNNVVMAEAAHTSLAFWQANRPETAFQLFKGELLDSMFTGLCPGNVGAMTSHDMARGEAQRDFADGIGINARTLIEGLFGVKPDVLAGELKIVPGFPARWNDASIQHPDFNFTFHRDGLRETYQIEPKFSRSMTLNLQIAALRTQPEVSVNGKSGAWTWATDMPGTRRIEVKCAAADKTEVVIDWRGDVPGPPSEPEAATPSPEMEAFDWNKKISASERFEAIDLTPYFNDKVTQIFANEYRSPRSPFASLATPIHGIGGWCEPNATFDVDDSGLRHRAAENNNRIIFTDGLSFATPGDANAKNVVFTSQWDNYPHEVSIPLSGKSSHAFLMMAGSTGAMQSQFDNGEIVVTYTDGSHDRLALRNPTNWWPIDQDYLIDDYAFRRDDPIPPRIDLKTGNIRILDLNSFKGRGGKVPGGAATVLEMPLNPEKELKSLTIHALANEVVIGIMGVTLER